MKTLVLNSWNTPALIVRWETAITMLLLEKCELVEAYDEVVSSPSVSMPMPAVVRLTRTVPMLKRAVKYSKANVFLRDRHTCQYCGTRQHASKLNLDHVVPRAHGGRTTWENIVTSCVPCNSNKRDRLPTEAGMRLLAKPVRPRTLPLSTLELSLAKVPEKWIPYAKNDPYATALTG
jgi:5-methylcytosine-specific restriction endonuclease McrA